MWGIKLEEKIEENEENMQMIEEQRKEFYEVIDWDEKIVFVDDVDILCEVIKFVFEVFFSIGSFIL